MMPGTKMMAAMGNIWRFKCVAKNNPHPIPAHNITAITANVKDCDFIRTIPYLQVNLQVSYLQARLRLTVSIIFLQNARCILQEIF